MKTNKHGITLTENLYNELLKQNNKSIMIAGAGHMFRGDLIRITEITKNKGIATGRASNFVITGVKELTWGALNQSRILSLQKYFTYE